MDNTPKPERILVIDDDVKLCGLIAEYLGGMGYHVETVNDGPNGLELAATGGYDAVILDVMLPGMDGFELLRTLRTRSTVPVLMLTSRGDETDRIVGLEMGADDYLPKTFSTRELLARLRAVTRRSRPSKSERGDKPEERTILTSGELVVDTGSHEVTLGGRPAELTPIEFALLVRLMEAAGRVLSRQQLLDHVADRDYEVFDRSIDMHISSLRKKLGEDPRSPKFIKTVRAAGYIFIEKVTK